MLYTPIQHELGKVTSELFAGPLERVPEEQVVLAGSGILPTGTVLAEDSGNGNKLVPVDSASATTSIQTPYAVLAFQVDATGGDVEAWVWLTGNFRGSALAFGGTDTLADHRDALRRLGILVTSNAENEL